jgi:hypothetical protein
MKYASIVLAAAALALPWAASAAVLTDESSGSVDVNVPTAVQVGVSASTSASAGAGSQAATTTGGSTTTANAGGIGLETNAMGVAVVNAAQVASSADLSVFSNNLAVQDSNVARVDASSGDAVTVEYKHPARLFGFIPVTINSSTTVAPAADGSVSVRTTLPWWHVFVSGVGDVTAADATLQNSTTVAADASAGASAQAKAQIAQAVVAALDAQFKAQVQ